VPAPSTPSFALAPYDFGAALRLERELGVSHVLAQILVRRGYDDPDEARQLLHPDERHDPFEFSGMEQAVNTIRERIRSGDRIFVHGDYDADGVCATAVMVRALRSLGADPGWYLPSRSADGYGLAESTVRRLAAHGCKLLITVDCGITAREEVALARTLGMDVIVTDHHQRRSDGALPECAIVHPEVCDYPFTGLCGTAVAYKLAEALGAGSVAADLELVALATVADLMPLRGENRTLVRAGLEQMADTDRPGLRALMQVSATDPSGLDASCLGFRLAPRINAAGRLGRADGALELLLTPQPARAEEIAAELDRINGERRAVERQIETEAEAQVRDLGERSFYLLAGRGWHAGVVGIVASQIVEQYHRPAVLIALDANDGQAPAHGSGRSIPGFDLLAALDSASADLLRYGGHRAAAGVTVDPARIPALRAALESHADAVLTPELLTPRAPADALASVGELSLGLAEELLSLEPCGAGNPAPRLLVPGAHVEAVQSLSGGRHARFNVTLGGAAAAAIAFGCDGHVPGADGTAVDASFKLERNVWHGVVEPRLILRDAVEVVSQPVTALDEPADGDYLASVVTELQRPASDELEATKPLPELDGRLARTLVDRRGQSPLVAFRDACAAAGAEQTLVLCADVPRRLTGLEAIAGGCTVLSYAAAARKESILDRYVQLVALDPPASARQQQLLRCGSGYVQLAWGAAEVRFSQQIYAQEYSLRGSLVDLYRALRRPGRVAGAELESLLRGAGRWPRGPELAARLVRVLTELELASFDPELPELRLAGREPTKLECSNAYRLYTKINEDGQRFLSSSTSPQHR
jgi:single-stranded-DNA-specific exonuclease